MYRITEYVERARAAGYEVTTRAVDAAGIHVGKGDFYQRFQGIGDFVAWVKAGFPHTHNRDNYFQETLRGCLR